MSNDEYSQKRILELEAELQRKSSELLMYKEEISRINAQLEKLIERVRKELEMGNQIHEFLLPTEIPNIPGFEFSAKFKPSSISGGDYYEILHHEDKSRFGLLMASSSGYSMSALFLSVLLKYTSKMASRGSMGPKDFLVEIQNEMQKKMTEEDSASVFYASFDRRNNELTYTCCGHILVAHYSYSQKECRELPAEESRIVKAKKLDMKEHVLVLEPRDRLLLCSEGLLFEENPNGEFFGKSKILQIFEKEIALSPHELRNEIFVHAQEFRQHKEQKADQSLLLMEVKDRVISLARS